MTLIKKISDHDEVPINDLPLVTEVPIVEVENHEGVAGIRQRPQNQIYPSKTLRM